jgi:hypothetical protein
MITITIIATTLPSSSASPAFHHHHPHPRYLNPKGAQKVQNGRDGSPADECLDCLVLQWTAQAAEHLACGGRGVIIVNIIVSLRV